MNLVQISEHLKDVPMQALAAYANGKDPMVPAYMATGEMLRREAMKQRSAASQQAGQGQKPTVKEQIEQKAGLMSLQAQQQQQAQQQMMQQAQAQPMPTPPQTPQPSMQEEEQPEFAMGGIAQLPVNYDFASGGIIAFAGEGRSDVPVVTESEEEKKLRVMRELLSKGNIPMPQDAQAMRPSAAQPAQTEKPLSLQELMSGPATLKAATQALNPQSIEDINTARLRARELAGVKGEYGDEQRKRLGEEEAQYKRMLKDREFNNLLALLSGIGQGGLGGAAPAYLQSQASQQAADMAQKRRMNQMYGDIDAKQREEGLGAATSMTGEVSKQRGLAGEAGTGYAKLAIDNVNAQARAELQYKRELEMAKERNANELALQEIKAKHDLKLEDIRRKNQFALESFRSNAPTDEQRNFDSYLLRWKKNPENKGKQETEAFSQYSIERAGGSGRGDKPYITGLNQLLESYQEELKTLEFQPETNPEKQRVRAAIKKAQKDLEAAVGRGIPVSSAGGNVVDFGSLK